MAKKMIYGLLFGVILFSMITSLELHNKKNKSGHGNSQFISIYFSNDLKFNRTEYCRSEQPNEINQTLHRKAFPSSRSRETLRAQEKNLRRELNDKRHSIRSYAVKRWIRREPFNVQHCH